MISRKKALLIGSTVLIVLLLITNIFTFYMANKVQLKSGDRVVMSRDDYNELITTYNKYSKLDMLEEFINAYYLRDVDNDDLLVGSMKGMFEALEDPYSVYMTKDEFDSLMEDTEGTYGGIGIIVHAAQDNLITVVSPIEDTPGERAGLKPEDKIIKVNNKEFTADKMDDAIKIMKGEPGTDVNITILRKNKAGEPEYFDVTITREQIKLKTIKSDMLENNIGYIRITSFDKQTYNDFKSHLNTLEKNGAKGLIIDLRNNPGGLLDQSAKIADELMGEETIVYTQTKDGAREYLKSDIKKINMPLVLLVNGGSASASEIVSGAIKDTNSGVLVGTKTFGKGVVQRIKKLSDGSGFKITVSEYFTPSGVNIHGVGIEPDVVIELNEDAKGFGLDYISDDNQLEKAIEIINDKIR